MSTVTILSYPPGEALLASDPVEGKFIQFRYRGGDYLLFATREEHRFHNQMLGRFLEERDIPHRWRDKETLEFDAAVLQLSGGGRFRYSQMEQSLELYDNSQAYGRFREEGLAEQIAAADHPFATAMVTIR